MASLQIDIEDPESILSKTQQKKIRRFLQDRVDKDWSPKELTDMILYPDLVEPYPFFRVEHHPKRWLVRFSRSEFTETEPEAEAAVHASHHHLDAEILIDDPESLLTKNQKKKIRHWVSHEWRGEEAFYDQLDSVLGLVVYPEGVSGYNRLIFDLEDKKLVLHFSRVEEKGAEDKREQLRKKLKARLRKVDPQDLVWKTYHQLKSRLPHVASKFIPDPDQVAANTEMYRAMMNGMPSNHPVAQYLKLMIV